MAIAYGFIALADIFPQTVQERITEVNDAITATLAEHNRQMAANMGLFIEPTTEKTIRFNVPAQFRLSPGDEFSRARPTKGLSQYDVAFPLQAGQGASALTRQAAAKLTIEKAEQIMMGLQLADARWLRDHILAALFTNVTWTCPAKGEDAALTIYGPANGDTTVYLQMSGVDQGATDTHFLYNANAIGNTYDPYPTIYSELHEHPENAGEVVALIPSGLKATTEALTAFYPVADPRIQLGSGSGRLIQDLGVNVPGKLIGYHSSGVWIVEWASLPAGYIVATTTQAVKPLRMRQETIPALQGFQKVATRNDHPFLEDHWERIAGFGAWNRVGVVVYLIGQSSYSIPTGYSSPMA